MEQKCALAKSVQGKVDSFFLLQDRSYLLKVFEKHADSAKQAICRERLDGALQDLDLHLEKEDVDVLYLMADMDETGSLSFEEFEKVIKQPSKVEQWIDTLPLSKLLARCLSIKDGTESLQEICQIGRAELDVVIEVFCENLQQTLSNELSKLSKCYELMNHKLAEGNNPASAKFQIFTMACGAVEDFHKGLVERVGAYSSTHDLNRSQVRGKRSLILDLVQELRIQTSPKGWRTSIVQWLDVTTSSAPITMASGRRRARSSGFHRAQWHVPRSCNF